MTREKARFLRDDVPPSGSAAAHGKAYDDGQTLQVAGSRETLVMFRNQWLSENNDLGGKLDTLNASVKEATEVLQSIHEMLQALTAD